MMYACPTYMPWTRVSGLITNEDILLRSGVSLFPTPNLYSVLPEMPPFEHGNLLGKSRRNTTARSLPTDRLSSTLLPTARLSKDIRMV